MANGSPLSSEWRGLSEYAGLLGDIDPGVDPGTGFPIEEPGALSRVLMGLRETAESVRSAFGSVGSALSDVASWVGGSANPASRRGVLTAPIPQREQRLGLVKTWPGFSLPVIGALLGAILFIAIATRIGR